MNQKLKIQSSIPKSANHQSCLKQAIKTVDPNTKFYNLINHLKIYIWGIHLHYTSVIKNSTIIIF